MRIKSLHVLGSLVLAAVSVHGQSYYQTRPMECTGVGGPIDIVDSTGARVGFSCFVTGTFTWFAAGGAWSTAIRVAAPSSGAIGIDYTFYDTNGTKLSMDAGFNGGASVTSAPHLQFYVNANEPAEVDLLGATSTAPNYSSIASGTVAVAFFCPDAATCSNLLPQLLYSALPSVPWSLSAPIAWDNAPVTTRWSAEGIDDGGQHHLSFVIYNQGKQFSADFVMQIYDSKGNFYASATTKSIPCLPLLASGFYGEAGVYGDVVSSVFKKGVPAGLFKLVIDGGPSVPSAVQVLQFNGPSATTVQVTNDDPAPRLPGAWNARVATMSEPIFQPIPD